MITFQFLQQGFRYSLIKIGLRCNTILTLTLVVIRNGKLCNVLSILLVYGLSVCSSKKNNNMVFHVEDFGMYRNCMGPIVFEVELELYHKG